MLEGVKNFVKVHRRVLIGLLFFIIVIFCFSRFLSRDAPCPVRKGGIVTIDPNGLIGMDIKVNRWYGLWLLSPRGEQLVYNENGVGLESWGKSNRVRAWFFEGASSLSVILENPVESFTQNPRYNKSTILNLFAPDISVHSTKKMGEALKEIKAYIEAHKYFDFCEIIGDSKLLDEEKEEIKKSYAIFSIFMRYLGKGDVRCAHYIGQQADPSARAARASPLCVNKETEFSSKIAYDHEERDPDLSNRYNSSDKVIRQWYKKDPKTTGRLFTDFDRTPSGIVEVGKEGQTADIYPAQKAVMMVFFLTYLFTLHSFKKDACDKLIAVYIIYIHLFNSLCCCRMGGSWNTAVKNSYVYEFNEENNTDFHPNMNINPDDNVEESGIDFRTRAAIASEEGIRNAVNVLMEDEKVRKIILEESKRVEAQNKEKVHGETNEKVLGKVGEMLEGDDDKRKRLAAWEDFLAWCKQNGANYGDLLPFSIERGLCVVEAIEPFKSEYLAKHPQ